MSKANFEQCVCGHTRAEHIGCTLFVPVRCPTCASGRGPTTSVWATSENWAPIQNSLLYICVDPWHMELLTKQSSDNEQISFSEHTSHVADFLNEMWATLADPVDPHGMKVRELCQALLEAARNNRQALQERGQEIARLKEALQTCEEFAKDVRESRSAPEYLQSQAVRVFRIVAAALSGEPNTEKH